MMSIGTVNGPTARLDAGTAIADAGDLVPVYDEAFEVIAIVVATDGDSPNEPAVIIVLVPEVLEIVAGTLD